MAKKKTQSGGARLVASGKKPVLLGLEPEQYKKISEAAKQDNRPMTQFLVHYGLKEAEKILKKSSQNT